MYKGLQKRQLLAALGAAGMAVPVFAGTAGADSTMRIASERTLECHFRVTLDVFSGGETVTIDGVSPSSIVGIGDTNPTVDGGWGDGVALGEGTYIIQWDGADHGAVPIDFTVSTAVGGGSEAVAVPICDDLATAERLDAYASTPIPEVAPGEIVATAPPVVVAAPPPPPLPTGCCYFSCYYGGSYAC